MTSDLRIVRFLIISETANHGNQLFYRLEARRNKTKTLDFRGELETNNFTVIGFSLLD